MDFSFKNENAELFSEPLFKSEPFENTEEEINDEYPLVLPWPKIELDSNFSSQKGRKKTPRKRQQIITHNLDVRSNTKTKMESAKTAVRKLKKTHSKQVLNTNNCPKKNLNGTSHASQDCDKQQMSRGQVQADIKTKERKKNEKYEGQKFLQETEELTRFARKQNAFAEKISCSVCGKFVMKDGLSKHLKIHTKRSRPYKCDTCGKTFITRGNLSLHETSVHSEERPFPCKECGKSYKTRCSLYIHAKTHGDTKPLQCHHCPKVFSNSFKLGIHEKRHLGLKSFVCNICGKKFTEGGSRNRHMLIHTGQKNFICNECGKTHYHKGALEVHMVKHFPPERTFLCDVCGKGFYSKARRASHMVRHSDERPLECNYCGKTFSQRGSLRGHMLQHTGEKPHSCDICGRRFVQKRSLNYHLKAHEGLKPLACQVCGMRFLRPLSLWRHNLLHLDVKKYACKLCDLTFADPGAFSRHKAKHATQQSEDFVKDENLKCSYCGLFMSSLVGLSMHLRMHKEYKKPFKARKRYKEKKVIKSKGPKIKKEKIEEPEDDETVSVEGPEAEIRISRAGRVIHCPDRMIFTLQKVQMTRAARILRRTKDREAAKRIAPTLLTREIAEMDEPKSEKTFVPEVVKPANPTYQCSKCGRVLSSPEMLQRHLLAHPIKNLHNCVLCDLQVVGQSAFRSHLVLHLTGLDEGA